MMNKSLFEIMNQAVKQSFSEMDDFINDSIALANKQIMAEQRLQSILSNKPNVTQESIDSLKRYASQLQAMTTISDEVGIQGMSQLAQHVHDPANIQALTMAMYDLAAGTHGAQVSMDDIKKTSESLGKALSGDANALAGILPSLSEVEKQMLQFGTEAERTALIVQKIEASYGGMAQAMAQTPVGQAEKLKNEWNSFKETIGVGFMPIWTSLMDMMMTAMPKIQQTLTTVFSIIFGLLEGVIHVAAQVVQFFVDNWPIVEAILTALAVVYIAMVIAKLWAMLPPILAQALAWMAVNLPILLIVGAIALVLLILNKLGVTADQVLGFIGGLFGTLYAIVYNIIAFLWNIISSFVEFFANVFNHPIYSVKKLFINLFSTILDFVKSVAEAIDWVLGTKLADGVITLQTQMEDWLVEEPEGYRAIGHMQMKSIKDSAENGYQMGANLANGLSDAWDGFNLSTGLDPFADMGNGHDGSKNLDSVGEVGEVGKIRDSVDISSEDLKMMRELAEMNHIQNFVTLHPQISFGDTHIRQDGRSVDEIVSNITQRLTEEISSSAQGVYGFG